MSEGLAAGVEQQGLVPELGQVAVASPARITSPWARESTSASGLPRAGARGQQMGHPDHRQHADDAPHGAQGTGGGPGPVGRDVQPEGGSYSTWR